MGFRRVFVGLLVAAAVMSGGSTAFALENVAIPEVTGGDGPVDKICAAAGGLPLLGSIRPVCPGLP